MNSVISNLTYLITGNRSSSYVKELKPYLLVLHLNLIGLVGLKLVKIVLEIL
jgi:hypothetical protein